MKSEFFLKLIAFLLCLLLCAGACGCAIPEFIDEALGEFLGEDSADIISQVFSDEEDSGVRRVECDNISEEIDPESPFETVDPDDYYQYSQLSSREQKVYRAIHRAVKKCEITVDMTKFDIDYDRALDLVEIYMADHPEAFYLSKQINATHFEDSDTAVEIRLSYTDGFVTDEIEGDELTEQADRELIEEQIEEFNNACEEVLSGISINASPLKRERYIHDFIVKNTYYDEAAVALKDSDLVPRAYDAYGAAINGRAVCEGYSKYFQYLCYLSGINANQVIGTGDGEPHMWNVVFIDDEWYHVDVTWDDPVGGKGKIFDDYFNLSWYNMSVDHVIKNDILAVPKA